MTGDTKRSVAGLGNVKQFFRRQQECGGGGLKVNSLVFSRIRNKGLAFWPKHRNTVRMRMNASYVTTEEQKTFSEIRKEKK
jgi:hypothetical protein